MNNLRTSPPSRSRRYPRCSYLRLQYLTSTWLRVISCRGELEFDLCDGFGGVEALRACFRACNFERSVSACVSRIQGIKAR